MITTEIRNSIQLHANHFPWAPPRSARRMAVRLIRAKHYLTERGIYAIHGDGFKYLRSTGSVLTK